MANNGVCLDLADGHGEIDADAVGLLVGLEGFERLEYCAAWLKVSTDAKQVICYYYY